MYQIAFYVYIFQKQSTPSAAVEEPSDGVPPRPAGLSAELASTQTTCNIKQFSFRQD